VVANTFPTYLSLCSLWHRGPDSSLQNSHCVELGCGDGANLLPLAFYNPDSAFVGIDSSRTEIDRARVASRCLGLENIHFVLRDVRDLKPTDVAPFDYVIAHGLYSWVPEDARDAILSFCRENLAPTGLAYISYNAQPGWAIRRLVRETLLRDRSVREAAVQDKAQKAIDLAARLLEDLPSRDYAHAVLLAEELERVRDGRPSYVFHEYLTEVNEGFWFRDFVERAQRYDLDYVADAQFCRWEGHVPAELKDALARRDLDPIEQEETADLLGDRYFRASILCRSDAPRASISQQELLEEIHIATSLSAESDPFDLTEGVVERFAGTGFTPNNEPEVTLNASITKAAIVLLSSRWPSGMRLQALFDQAANLLETHGCEVQRGAREQLSEELVTLFEAGQVDFRLKEPVYSAERSEYPQAHALARFEAEHREALTTPYHVPIPFEPEALALVPAMDGSRPRAELQQAFGQELVDQTVSVMARWGLLG
jgi:ubiquinone/menaquinone biosynthesis C-methylase UbiE/methyltransferase-like protein